MTTNLNTCAHHGAQQCTPAKLFILAREHHLRNEIDSSQILSQVQSFF